MQELNDKQKGGGRGGKEHNLKRCSFKAALRKEGLSKEIIKCSWISTENTRARQGQKYSKQDVTNE